jgi:hypothetical protein
LWGIWASRRIGFALLSDERIVKLSTDPKPTAEPIEMVDTTYYVTAVYVAKPTLDRVRKSSR